MNYTPPPAWMDDTPCKDHQQVMFANDRGDGTRRAKNICATCPHTEVCLAFAIDNQLDFGVWGGVGPQTRRNMRRGTDSIKRRAVAVCGTIGGWTVHKRRGEPTCRACKDAKNVADRRLRAERRAARNAVA